MKHKISRAAFRRLTAFFMAVIMTAVLLINDYAIAEAKNTNSVSAQRKASKKITLDKGRMSEDELQEYTEAIEDQGNYREIEEERTASSTTYEIADGVKQVVYYSGKVRFKDKKGELVDYDPSLVKIGKNEKSSKGKHSLKGYLYKNKAGDMKNYIPKEVSGETPVLMENEDYSISVAPVFEGSENRNSFAVSDEGLARAHGKKEEVVDIYGETDTKLTTASYTAEDESYEVEYESTEYGVKENIILNEVPKSNVWKFEIALEGGIVPVKDRCYQGISFYLEGTDDIVGGIQSPYMNDATGNNYSEAITYDISPKIGEDGHYILTMTVDKAYLNSKKTVYPVTIDPSYSWTGSSSVYDVYVLNASPYNTYNYYSSGVTGMYAGKTKSNGVARTYISFNGLSTKVSGYSVASAKLNVYETGGGSSGITVEAYKTSTSYTKSSLTWNNKPGYSSTLLSSFKSTGTAQKSHSLDITSYVRGVAKGNADNGIILKATSESTAGKVAILYGSRHSSTSYRPKLTVTYYDKPATPSSLSLSTKYVKKGSSVDVTWADATSNSIKDIEYRIASYDDVNKKEIADVVAYSASTIIGTTASGKGTVNGTKSLSDGAYKLVVRARDNYESVGVGKGIVFYIDGTVPALSASLTPATAKGNYSYDVPAVRFTASDTNYDKVQFRIGSEGAYTDLSTATSGTVILPEGLFNRRGVYQIYIRALDKAGNEKVAGPFNYYYSVRPSSLASYDAKNVIAQELVNGNTRLSWETDAADIASDIVYDIYRSKDPECRIADAELVISDLNDNKAEISNTEQNTLYYYRILAKRIERDDTYTNGNCSAVIKSKTSALNEACRRLGLKDYLEYESCDTPTGSGYVEKSYGNFAYMEQDFELPSPQLPIGISRYYNSQSGMTGIFGNWTYSYDMQIAAAPNGTDLLYRDCTGAVYTFKKQANGTYLSEFGKDMVLRVINSSERVSVKHVDTEAVAYTNQDSFAERNILVDEYYSITDKDKTIYYFNRFGMPSYTVETNGTYQVMEYDQKGLLLAVSSSNKQTINFTYDEVSLAEGFPLVSQITLADGSRMDYHYTNGLLTEAVHMANNETEGFISYKYEYNENGKLSVIYDALDTTYRISYNGEVVDAFTYPDGEYSAFSYDFDAHTTEIMKFSPDNRLLYKTGVTYDDTYGMVTESVDAEGKRLHFEYHGTKIAKADTVVTYNPIPGPDGIVSTAWETVKTEATYDENGNVLTDKDPSGNILEYTYYSDSSNEAVKNQPKTLVTKDSKGKILSSESYEYDSRGNLTKIVDNLNQETTIYKYDERGNLISESDDYQGVESSDATAEYDENGNEVRSDGTSGALSSHDETKYNRLGAITYSKDDTGLEIYYTYNGFGRLVKTEYKLEGKTETEESFYDKNGALLKEIAKDGTVSEYSYDNMNRLVCEDYHKRDAVRTYKTSYAYAENVAIYLAPNYTRNYPLVYKETQTTKAAQSDLAEYIVSETYYDALGRVIREKAGGIYTDYSYDDQGRVKTIFMIGTACDDASEGKLALALYDKEGNLYGTVVNPAYNGSNYVVDSADSVLTLSTYDSSGKVLTQTDGNGTTISYEYDENSRIKKVKLDDGTGTANERTYTYDVKDADDNFVSTVTDALGRNSQVITNAAGETLKVIDGSGTDSIITSYEYDKNGNVYKTIYSDGAYTETLYDSKLRPEKVKRYSSKGIYVSASANVYDDNDNVIESVAYNVTDGNEIPYRYSFYEYDEFDTLVTYSELNSTDRPSQAEIDANKLRYIYDIEDKLVSVEYPEKFAPIRSISYIYNADRWLTSIKMKVQAEGKEVENLVREYSYAKDGKVSGIRDFSDPLSGSPEYTQKSYVYDLFDRVTRMEYRESTDLSAVRESYEYTYDKNSNILSERIYNDYPAGEADKIDELRTHTYDKLDRLTATKITNNKSGNISNIAYAYDKVGNRIKEVKDGDVTTYQYNGLNQIISAKTISADGKTTSNKTYQFDKNGNQIRMADSVSGEVCSYAYDELNQLVSFTKKKGSQTLVVQTNVYDGSGQRIRKTENGVETNYFYDGGEVLYTEDGSGNINAFNVTGDSDNYTATIRYTDGLQYYTYNKDIKGSVSNLVDDSGNSVVSYEYSDFGITTIHGDTDFYNEICYTQAIFDASTGLYYMNARYYDPEDGRFLSQDTFRGTDTDPGTWNLYTYCANNPVKYVDPSGHFFKSIKSLIKTAVKKIAPAVSAVKKTVSKTVTKVATKATATVKKVATTVKKAVTTVSKAASVTVKKATTAVKTTAKKVVKVAKKVSKNKTVRKVAIGTAVIGACAAAVVITGGAATGCAGAVAANALKGAVLGAASGAVTGGVVSAAKYAVENKTLAGSAGAIVEGMASGYASGAISGAIAGLLKGPQCFVAGTPVATAGGFVAIETIEAGDLVLAADSETGEVVYKKVVQVFKNTTDEITHVTIRNHNGATETIDATPQHPFYVDGIGWVEASSLHEGMTVWFADGSKGTVADILNEGMEEPVAVYNFEVEDFHTYFVGENAVLVHNTCGDTVKSTFRGKLRKNMLKEGPAPGSDYQAHHGLPWHYKKYFNKAGIDVNDAAYGRWVKTGPGGHQSWSRRYDKIWADYIDRHPTPDKADIIDFFEKLNGLK